MESARQIHMLKDGEKGISSSSYCIGGLMLWFMEEDRSCSPAAQKKAGCKMIGDDINGDSVRGGRRY